MDCTPRNPCRRVTGPEWTEDQCRWCWRKRYPAGSQPVLPRLACIHRGAQLDTISCRVCTSVQYRNVPVHACALHGKCILFAMNDDDTLGFIQALKKGETPALWQCKLCDERTSPAPPSSPRPQPGPACPQPAS